jgi:hypothetical protein
MPSMETYRKVSLAISALNVAIAVTLLTDRGSGFWRRGKFLIWAWVAVMFGFAIYVFAYT